VSSQYIKKYKPRLYKNASFKIGVAIDPTLYQKDSNYKKVVDFEFNSVTPENALKMNRIIDKKGVYNWEISDSFINSVKRPKRIHGHTLVWHRGIPKWLENYKGNQRQWDSILKSYITTVVKKYKGKIHAWDVVNEAFENDGSYRKSIWYNNLGESYIEKSFIYAHQADPKAILFYNDFGQESHQAKNDSILKMLKNLKLKRVPIHGVGFQLHTYSYQKLDLLANAIHDISKLKLKVHFSEVSVRVNTKMKKDFIYSDEVQKQQFEFLSKLIHTYKEIPKRYQYGITFWNVGDKDTYLKFQVDQNQYPQIFDESYQRKKFFYIILDALAS
jgi:endo-1,4-beta-xylanase